ncbi:MAG: choice-of-anchor B family protein [Halobacteriovoraceae bacterium]|nr:choice-of-anchor B family protein [Halobacteriovoraceae bacterium]
MKVLFVFLLSLSIYSSPYSQHLEVKGHFKLDRDIEYNDIWGYTDPVDGREYAFLGVVDGTSVIEITDPENLREVAFIESNRSTWKDIKTYGFYAYVVTENRSGLQILDLSGLPEKVELINTQKDVFTSSHNIFIDEERGILFAEGNMSRPVFIFSLDDPENPVLLSHFGVECHDIYARDGLAYISEGGHGTIGIYSYADPSNPTLVSRFEIEDAGYVHNAWLSEDGNYLMTTEENSGKTMKLFDVSNFDNVFLVDEVIAPNELAHNTHIKGDFAYVSHYGAGLRIYDLSSPYQIEEAAWWMKADEPGKGFVDAWGAFPFFESGKVIVSDISDGLFVFEF